MSCFWPAVYALWSREIVRFYRQPSRVIGALGSPLIFWFLIGSGIGTSFKNSQGGYLVYFFPGTLLMILFFTAVFSTISLIEDRREGFLQGVLVAPAPRSALVLGKILGGATLAWVQAVLFLALSPLVGIHLSLSGCLQISAVLFISAFLMTGMGFLIAWQFDSIQGFHAVMNILLMPMWILSGSLFPPEGASYWLRGIMLVNPLSYSHAALRLSLFNEGAGSTIPVLITAVLGLVFFVWAAHSASRPALRNLK